jgi:hypothetical protein
MFRVQREIALQDTHPQLTELGWLSGADYLVLPSVFLALGAFRSVSWLALCMDQSGSVGDEQEVEVRGAATPKTAAAEPTGPFFPYILFPCPW